jgi:hypothetical protein
MHTKFWSENLKGRKKLLQRSRYRWEDNIRMDHREKGGRSGLNASGSR